MLTMAELLAAAALPKRYRLAAALLELPGISE
jgi:hypothetical protein